MGKIFCFQNSKYFKIILFILIFFSFCFSSYANDVKKRAKNMNKMTKKTENHKLTAFICDPAQLAQMLFKN